MKRKFLCLVICAFLCVGAIMFSACNKGAYNLADFNKDYEAIANSYNNVKLNGGYLEFDLQNISQALEGNEEETEKFVTPLNEYYSVLTKNSLVFIVSIKGNLNTNGDVNKTTRNAVRTQLDNLKTSVGQVNTQIDEFNKILRNTAANDTSRNDYYDMLTGALVEFYDNCRTLSSTLADAYFGKIRPNENYNYYENSTDFGSNLKLNLDDLTVYQIFNVTQNYIEMNVDGGDSTKIADSFAAYKNDVSTLDDKLSLLKSNRDATFSDTEAARVLAVQLYNLNSKVINEREMYLRACNSVIYAQVANEQSDYNDTNCVMIIAGYGETLKEYTTVLLGIYDNLLGTVTE